MAYTVEDIDKILQFSTWSDKKKIDELLFIDAKMYCNLGIDSLQSERVEVKRNSSRIYRAIKTINNSFGQSLLYDVYKK